MSEIVVEHNPSEEKLKALGVSSWPTWSKEVSKFPLTFEGQETAYVLEGKFIVTPKGGKPVTIVAGDFVVFPDGLQTQWEVVEPLRKHYSYD